jgi:DNA-binding NtrC family response regulator
MADRIIVMPGSGQFDFARLRAAATEFGFNVETAGDVRELAADRDSGNIAAVLFHRDVFGPRCSWLDALQLLESELPGVRLVASHRFAEAIDWASLADAGAYHALWLPLKDNELRQCLGFVWQAEKRRAEEQRPRPLPARSLTAGRLTAIDRPMKYTAA